MDPELFQVALAVSEQFEDSLPHDAQLRVVLGIEGHLQNNTQWSFKTIVTTR